MFRRTCHDRDRTGERTEGGNDRPLVACPKCGALNLPSVSYCIGCGSFLPPPVGHPSFAPAVPIPAPKEDLSTPMKLLIVAVALAIAIPLLLGLFLVPV